MCDAFFQGAPACADANAMHFSGAPACADRLGCRACSAQSNSRRRRSIQLQASEVQAKAGNEFFLTQAASSGKGGHHLKARSRHHNDHLLHLLLQVKHLRLQVPDRLLQVPDLLLHACHFMSHWRWVLGPLCQLRIWRCCLHGPFGCPCSWWWRSRLLLLLLRRRLGGWVLGPRTCQGCGFP